MADDKTNRGSQDRNRINVNQEHELRYWSNKFGVTTQQLKKAVQQVGPMADAVERQLRGR